MSIRFGADTPMGLKPYDKVLRITRYNVSTTGVQIFPGDPVIVLTEGAINLQTTATQIPIGVSAEWTTASQASATLLVYDHPDQLFVIQEDADTSNFTQGQIGLNYDFVRTAGTTASGPQGRHEIDTSTGDVAGAGVSTVVRAIKVHEGEVGATSAAPGGVTVGDQVFATTAASGAQKKVIVGWVTHRMTSATGI